MVCPTYAKWEVWFTCFHHFVKNFLQELFPVTEPVMPIAEPFHPCFSCKLRLHFPDLWHSKVIKTQVCGNMGLMMPSEQGLCFRGIGPLRKSLAPEFVIFRGRMKLWKIKCDYSCLFHIQFITVQLLFPAHPQRCNCRGCLLLPRRWRQR